MFEKCVYSCDEKMYLKSSVTLTTVTLDQFNASLLNKSICDPGLQNQDILSKLRLMQCRLLSKNVVLIYLQ